LKVLPCGVDNRTRAPPSRSRRPRNWAWPCWANSRYENARGRHGGIRVLPDCAHQLGDGQHEDRTPTHGYAETREAAMAAFAKSWRWEW